MSEELPFAVVLKHPDGQLRDLDCNTAKILRVSTYSIESYSHLWRSDKREFDKGIAGLPTEALTALRDDLRERRAWHRKWALRRIDSRSKVAQPVGEPFVLRIDGYSETRLLGVNGASGACVAIKPLHDPHDADHHDQMQLAEALPKAAWDEIRHRTRTIEQVEERRNQTLE